MKPAFYDSLDKIPDADRGDYKLVTEAGSPNFNKYVLDLDPQHPVAIKNVELLGEKTTRDATQAAAVTAATAPLNTQIQTLTQQLQAQGGLPAGQIAVLADTLTLLNNYKALGELDVVKKQVEEHGTLKADKEVQVKKEKFSKIAERNGMEPNAFAKLAAVENLTAEAFETREIPDAKGEKVKHDFVKTKDSAGADTTIAVGEYVKQSETFKPFLGSLYLSEEDKKKIKIPATKVGEKVEEKSAADAYLNSAYALPEAKT